MKPLRVIQATPKAKTKLCLKKGRLLMIPMESHLSRPRKKDLKQALIHKIMKKKTWLMTSLMVH